LIKSLDPPKMIKTLNIPPVFLNFIFAINVNGENLSITNVNFVTGSNWKKSLTIILEMWVCLLRENLWWITMQK